MVTESLSLVGAGLEITKSNKQMGLALSLFSTETTIDRISLERINQPKLFVIDEVINIEDKNQSITFASKKLITLFWGAFCSFFYCP